MSLRLEELVIDCHDFASLGTWWAEALGWEIIDQDAEVLEVRNPEGGPTLLFSNSPDEKVAKNRLHLDFVPDDQHAEVERLLSLGASRVDIDQGEQSWVVLADPEGNEFCILGARS